MQQHQPRSTINSSKSSCYLHTHAAAWLPATFPASIRLFIGWCLPAPGSACLSLTQRTERVHVCLRRAPDREDSAFVTGGVNGRAATEARECARFIHRAVQERLIKAGFWWGIWVFIVNYLCGIDLSTWSSFVLRETQTIH